MKKNQNQNQKKNKKRWIAASAIILLFLIGSASIGLGVYFGIASKKQDSNNKNPNEQEIEPINPQPLPPPPPTVIRPEVKQVIIKGTKPSYVEGETINVKAEVTMSEGNGVPNDLKYEWYIQTQNGNQLIDNQTTNTLTINAEPGMDGHSIFVRVIFNNKTIDSNHIRIIVNSDGNTPTTPIVSSVIIQGEQDFVVGDTIQYTSTVIMSDNNEPVGVSYQWYLVSGNQEELLKNQTNKDLSMTATMDMNNKSLVLKVTLDNKTTLSNQSSLSIKPFKPAPLERTPNIHFQFNGNGNGVYNPGQSATITAVSDIEGVDLSKYKFDWSITKQLDEENVDWIPKENLPNKSNTISIDNLSVKDNNMMIRCIATLNNARISFARRIYVQDLSHYGGSNQLLIDINHAIENFEFKPNKESYTREEIGGIEQRTILNQLIIPNNLKGRINSSMIADYSSQDGVFQFRFRTDDGSLSSRLAVVLPIKEDFPENEITDLTGTMHAISYDVIKNANSPLDIISKSALFKNAVTNMEKELKSGDWRGNGNKNQADFMATLPYNNYEHRKFSKLNQEVGIAGEYGNTTLEKMMYTPKELFPGYEMQQKYLNGFEETSSMKPSQADIDDLIDINQFGYLPSNMSQLLFYLELPAIEKQFNVKPNSLKEVKVNFDDEAGTLDILLILKDGSQNIYKFDTTNSHLRMNKEYRQYIYDRTFMMRFPTYYTTKAHNGLYPEIKTIRLSGTAWIFDRIHNKTLEDQGMYQFLVGTNLHVVDTTYGFNKDRSAATGMNPWQAGNDAPWSKKQKTYDKYWDGGFKTTNYKGMNIPSNVNETIATVQATSDFERHNEIKNRAPEYTLPVQAVKENPNDVDVAESIDAIQNERVISSSLNNKNVVQDAVWYTPSFTATGSYTANNNTPLGPVFEVAPGADPGTGVEIVNGSRTGEIPAAGGDFAVTKLAFKKEDVRNLFPSLAEVIDTDKEKQWYMGIGANNGKNPIPSANSTLFVGGYPANPKHRTGFNSVKSTGGKILSQKRYIGENKMGNVQSYWTAYNEEDNVKYNNYRGMVDWFRDNTFKSASMTEEQNKQLMPKGMEIQKVLQQSIITYSNEKLHDAESIMHNGSSGSMIINSRFELVGINYMGSWLESDSHSYYNFGMLFNNYTEEHKDMSIINEIKQKLISENTKTFILNP